MKLKFLRHIATLGLLCSVGEQSFAHQSPTHVLPHYTWFHLTTNAQARLSDPHMSKPSRWDFGGDIYPSPMKILASKSN